MTLTRKLDEYPVEVQEILDKTWLPRDYLTDETCIGDVYDGQQEIDFVSSVLGVDVSEEDLFWAVAERIKLSKEE